MAANPLSVNNTRELFHSNDFHNAFSEKNFHRQASTEGTCIILKCTPKDNLCITFCVFFFFCITITLFA